MNRTTRTVTQSLTFLAVGGLILAACGGDDDDAGTTDPATSETIESARTDPAESDTTEPAPTEAPSADTTEAMPEPTDGPEPTDAPSPDPTEAAGAAPLIELADTDLGQVIVAADGFTLYMFAPDVDGEPTCTGGCAGTWPPYLVDDGAELTAGAGLDPDLLGTVAHPDGGDMLTYGDWPLYYYAGDAAPGETNGQGVNDVWWVVDGTGAPVQNASLTTDEDSGSGFYDY